MRLTESDLNHSKHCSTFCSHRAICLLDPNLNHNLCPWFSPPICHKKEIDNSDSTDFFTDWTHWLNLCRQPTQFERLLLARLTFLVWPTHCHTTVWTTQWGLKSDRRHPSFTYSYSHPKPSCPSTCACLTDWCQHFWKRASANTVEKALRTSGEQRKTLVWH